jgi:DNA-binding Lrp family transcriptional regulator
MISALVLISVAPNAVRDAGEQLATFPRISEVYSTSGRYDLVAMVRGRSTDDIADVVTEEIVTVPGVQQTETLIAFRVHSRYDLERIFALGLEQ